MLLKHLLGDSIPETLLNLEMPDPFACDSRKVYQDDREIIGSPVFVEKIFAVYERASNVCSTSFGVVAFVYGCEWIQFTVSSADLFDSRKVTRILSDYGVLVTSNSARSVVKYFQKFVQENLCSMQRTKRYNFTGWHRERFLLPSLVTDEEIDSGNSCKYLKDSGDVKKLGTVIRRAFGYRGARLLMDLSLASVLLKPCGVRNFVVNVYGRSGGGKTAALRLATALWGSPMFMNEFNATQNAIENFALERNDLPTLVNEWQVTDRANRKQISNNIIHRFGEGRSKARLSRDLTQNIVKEFRSILICTAEEPMTNDESIQGVRARCVNFEMTPVLGKMSESKMFVDLDLCAEIYDVTQDNYGFIGRDFVNHIIREKGSLRDEYQKWYETALALRTDILPAHAQYIALIAMVDYRFQTLYLNRKTVDLSELEKDCVDFVGFLLSMLPSKDSQVDSERAFELLSDWIIENQSKFQKNPLDTIPASYYGFKKDHTWYIIPRIVRDFLFTEGFDYLKIFKEWYRAGKLSQNKSNGSYGKNVTDYRGYQKVYIDVTL